MRLVKISSIVLFLMTFSSLKSQPIKPVLTTKGEIEKHAHFVMKPVEFVNDVITSINIPVEFNSTELQYAIRIKLEKLISQKRMELMSKLQNGELEFNQAKAFADEVKFKLINGLQSFSSNKWMSFLEKVNASRNSNINPYEHEHSPLRVPGGPCQNPDFETCDFSSWDMYTGSVPYPSPAPYSFGTPVATTSYSTVSTFGIGGSASDQHYIVTGGTDQFGFPMVYPGGTCTAEIGDFTGIGNGASQIRQTFLVSTGDAILTLNYAVCLEDGGHAPVDQPYFKMRVYDAAGNSISCAEYSAVSGDGQPGWLTSGTWQYKNWTTVFIPLAPYLGQNVTVEFTVGDCSQGGHAGYAYVDASCDAMAFNMTAAAVCAGNPINISAPPGAASYSWSTGATSQTITTSTPGTYSVVVTPVTGSACSITLDTTIVAYPNPIADFIDDAPVCAGVPVNFTDQSNPSGATIATWLYDFGDGNTSSLQNPTNVYAASGTYNVTLTVTTSDGCSDAVTYPVTINAGGVANITPAGPFCNTDPITNLSATPAGGTWSSSCGVCLNSVTGAFNPAAATIGNNNITYSVGGACPSVGNAVIDVQEVTISSVVPTDIDCFGNANGTITINATSATQFSIDNGTTFQASNLFTGLVAGPYLIVVQNALGCTATSNTVINEPTQLTVVPGFQDESCFGACDGFVVIAPNGGTTPYVLGWTGPGGVTSSSALFNSVCVGAYTYLVTDANGCSVTGVTNVGGPTQVIITAINTTPEFCPNDCIGTITVSASGGTGGYNYSIDGGTTMQVPNNFTNICDGNYNIVVVDANGCQAMGLTSISAPNPLILTVSPTDTVCIGQSANLTSNTVGGTGAIGFAWSNGPTTQNQTIDPNGSTTYVVTATDANGCSVSDSILIVENPPLNVIAMTNATVCPGASAPISAVGNGGNGGPYTYTWINDQSASTLVGQNQNVTPGALTQYTVIVTDNCGTPADSASVVIGLYPLPAVTFTADTLQGCTPLVVNLSNTTNAALSASCSWDYGDGTTGTNCSDTHVFTTPGCYDIALSVTTINGCVVDTIIYNYICVYPYPVADFAFLPSPADVYNTEINFTNLTVGGNSYSWDFAGLGSSATINPQFEFPNTDGGIYPVCLATVNSYGCADTICHDVIILGDFIVYVPNAFTPDGDGVNDQFFPIVQGIEPESFDFMIFDRWGELIFRSYSPDNKWDGTHKDIKSKEDVYVWKLKVKSKIDGEKKEYIGHVSLLR